MGTTLESVSEREAVLSNGVRIPARTLVWTAGVKAPPLLGELGMPVDVRGRLSRKLRVVADWTTSLFFRRNTAELSMLGTRTDSATSGAGGARPRATAAS